MRQTKGNRLHIGFFGKRNVGKSSVVNKIIGQEISIVSDTLGTTTDVNQKSMELLPIGPVVLMDTAGIDDVGELGKLRVEKTNEAISRTDVAVVVFDNSPLIEADFKLLEDLKKAKVPILALLNKADLTDVMENSGADGFKQEELDGFVDGVLKASAKCDVDFAAKFKEALIKILPEDFVADIPILSDIVKPNEMAILVIPIDKEAPKGRLILPQVNVLRDLLDIGAVSVVCRENELEDAIFRLSAPPKIVITDSQAFKKVSEIVPKNVLLTSFSIIFARLKGDLKTFIKGAGKLDNLKNGDKILILESCSHHAVEDDIGKVKIPNLIRKYSGKNVEFEHFSGHDFPSDIEKYSLIIHCGACMTNRREVLNRINLAQEKNVAITNYGITIAKCLGILDRAIEPFA